MGYRSLLKRYIRHLMVVAGDHYIDQHDDRGVLSRREVAELSQLAAEVEREDYRQAPADHEAVGESAGRASTRRRADREDNRLP